MIVEYLDEPRSRVVGDMLAYRRVLKNETQPVAASKLGVHTSKLSAIELSKGAKGIEMGLLPGIEDYLGYQRDALVAEAGKVTKRIAELEEELSERLILTDPAGIPGRFGHLRLARVYRFNADSRFFGREFQKRNITPFGLPYLYVYLVSTDVDSLMESSQLGVVQDLTTAAFRAVHETIFKYRVTTLD